VRRLARPGPAALAGAAAIALLAAIAYQPFVAASYAYKDDYPSLLSLDGPGLGGNALLVLRGGRILYAYLYDLVFGACDGIDDLRWIRALAAVGAVAAGLAVAAVVRARGATRAESAILGAGVALLPAMHVPVGWASAFPFPWAAALGTLAGALCARGVECRRAGERRRGVRLLAAGAFLLLAALHVYQPSAQFFFVPFGASLVFAAPGNLRAAARDVAVAATLFAAVGAIHLAIFHAYVGRYPGGGPIDRAALLDPAELPDQARWYLGEALPNALRIFVVDRLPAIAVAVGVLAALGLLLGARRRGESAAPALAAGAALLPLAYAANLVVAHRWPSLRSTGAAATIAWILLAGGLFELAAATGRRAGVARRAAVVLLGAVVVAQALQIRFRIAPLVVDVQLREIAIVRARVAELAANGSRRVVFRRAHWSDAGVQPIVYDELGVPSSWEEWTPEPMLELFHRERTGRGFAGELRILAPEQPLPRRGFRIDVGPALRAGAAANHSAPPR
jgi:hypothetical protein